MSQGDFNRLLADAARELAGQKSTEATLEHAVGWAPKMISSCTSAGIAVVAGEGLETLAATDEQLREIDGLQFVIGEGPCLDALREQDAITSNDLSRDPRWPTWGRRIAEETGVRSSMSFRLFAAGGSLGALNLYSHQTEAFDSDDLDRGTALAAHVSVALAAIQQERGLQQALIGRTVIAQAQGIVMERFDIDADRAFQLLVRLSNHANLKLSRVALEIVTTRKLPD
jgi:GAF domain-containing protein